MDGLLLRLGSLLLGEPEEQTPEQRAARQRAAERRQLQAKSQRAVLLEDLELAVRALALFADAAEDAKLLLHDGQTVVNLLCLHLDRCMRHGLRLVDADADAAELADADADELGADTVKFFGVVKWTCTRVEALGRRQQLAALSAEPELLPRAVRGFVAAARAASALSSVRSDEGKARAFVRQALNTHVLSAAMGMVLGEGNLDLLASYYSDVALFRQRDDATVFLGLLSALDALPFAFRIDDPRLDADPDAMPFSTSAVAPTAWTSAGRRKDPPKLIEPEDMVLGRVRLCEADGETAVLAEKLVAHHELRPAFDSARGGNLLSDTLRLAAQSRRLDDAATAVLRFLELGYPEYDVLGVELAEVLSNPFLSGMARFEPALGLPDVAEACLCSLYAHVDAPGVFQVQLDAARVMELRDTVEELGGFHKDMTRALDAHEVAALLLQYLWELPEPLLTRERLDNFLACADRQGNAMGDRDRRALLKMLVDDLPWYCKPLLERICHWAATALQPSHARRNGLSLAALANALAPVLVRESHEPGRFRDEMDDPRRRKYPVGYQHGRSVRRRVLDDLEGSSGSPSGGESAAELGVRVVQMLLEHHAFLLRDFRLEMRDRRAKLKDKVVAMEALRFRLDEPVDAGNAEHAALLLRLWRCLLPAGDSDEQHEAEDEAEDESDLYVSDLTGEEEPSIDVAALLASRRWARSGFHTENPLGGFRGGGLLSLECLVFFLERYPDKAAAMMRRNALPGGQRYPFPVASVNVLRMLLRLLMLDEPPAVSSKLVLRHDPELEQNASAGQEEEEEEESKLEDDEEEDGAEGSKTPATRATVLRLRVAERVSRTPFWRVLDDREAFQKLHAMAFMLLDLHWLHSGATQMGFQPVLDATRRQMGWLLEQAPRDVDDMWATWRRVREQDAAKRTGGALGSVWSSVVDAIGGRSAASGAAALFSPVGMSERASKAKQVESEGRTAAAAATAAATGGGDMAAADPALAF